MVGWSPSPMDGPPPWPTNQTAFRFRARCLSYGASLALPPPDTGASIHLS